MIVNYPAVDVKLGSMGKPLPGIEVAIIDDSGNVLPPNRMGNLAIKRLAIYDVFNLEKP